MDHSRIESGMRVIACAFIVTVSLLIVGCGARITPVGDSGSGAKALTSATTSSPETSASAHAMGGIDRTLGRPQKLEGTPEYSLEEARGRAKFALRLPTDATSRRQALRRVLIDGSDRGEAFTMQYDTFEVKETPTNHVIPMDWYLSLESKPNLKKPEKVRRYRRVQIRGFEGIYRPGGVQMDGDQVISVFASLLEWHEPAPGGGYMRYSVSAYDADEARVREIAESLR